MAFAIHLELSLWEQTKQQAMKSLPEIKKDLKELLTEGIDLVLEAMEGLLGTSSEASNNLLLLKARYKECNKKLLTGLISDADAQLEFNRVRASLLEFIDSMEEADLQEKEAVSSSPPIYNGDVLYRIPHRMQKDVEVTCTVRLAFSKEELYIGLEKETHDVVKDLRISDVMGVELIDPSENAAFKIRTYSEQVQFVEKGLPTEWLFYVKPIHEGTFPLILKISVIEIINGVERKRNVVLEEEVQILSEPVPEEEDRASAVAGLSTAVAGIAISSGAKSASDKVFPGAPVFNVDTVRPPEFVQPQGPPPPMPSKSNTRKRLSTVLPIGLLLVVAVWALTTVLDPFGPSPINADPSLVKRFENAKNNSDIDELKNISELAPESELAQQSKKLLDSLEQVTWQAAVASNDPQKYLDRFPDGRFVNEANKILPRSNADKEPFQRENPSVNAMEQEERTTAPVVEHQANPRQGNHATAEEDANKPVPFASSARKPIFPGCSSRNIEKEESCTKTRIRRFVGKQLSYPDEALKKRVEGVVNVYFIVEKNGVVSSVKALNKLGYGCEEEAIRLVKKLPKFEPGKDANGRPLRVQYQLPVRFQLR